MAWTNTMIMKVKLEFSRQSVGYWSPLLLLVYESVFCFYLFLLSPACFSLFTVVPSLSSSSLLPFTLHSSPPSQLSMCPSTFCVSEYDSSIIVFIVHLLKQWEEKIDMTSLLLSSLPLVFLLSNPLFGSGQVPIGVTVKYGVRFDPDSHTVMFHVCSCHTDICIILSPVL